jgi:hypothetical protein
MDSASLSLEGIASGLVGLLLIGAIIKKAVDGWYEAKTHVQAEKRNPIITAVAAAWDRDQQERVIQLIERMTIALETLSDRQAEEMQKQLNWLVERVDKMPQRRRRTTTKKKPQRSG